MARVPLGLPVLAVLAIMLGGAPERAQGEEGPQYRLWNFAERGDFRIRVTALREERRSELAHGGSCIRILCRPTGYLNLQSMKGEVRVTLVPTGAKRLQFRLQAGQGLTCWVVVDVTSRRERDGVSVTVRLSSWLFGLKASGAGRKGLPWTSGTSKGVLPDEIWARSEQGDKPGEFTLVLEEPLPTFAPESPAPSGGGRAGETAPRLGEAREGEVLPAEVPEAAPTLAAVEPAGPVGAPRLGEAREGEVLPAEVPEVAPALIAELPEETRQQARNLAQLMELFRMEEELGAELLPPEPEAIEDIRPVGLPEIPPGREPQAPTVVGAVIPLPNPATWDTLPPQEALPPLVVSP